MVDEHFIFPKQKMKNAIPVNQKATEIGQSSKSKPTKTQNSQDNKRPNHNIREETEKSEREISENPAKKVKKEGESLDVDNMTLDELRAHIETLTPEEVIKGWRTSSDEVYNITEYIAHRNIQLEQSVANLEAQLAQNAKDLRDMKNLHAREILVRDAKLRGKQYVHETMVTHLKKETESCDRLLSNQVKLQKEKKEIRLEGAAAFRASGVFKELILASAGKYAASSLWKNCVEQISFLDGFKQGFDASKLDISKDGKFRPYKESARLYTEDDEFFTLRFGTRDEDFEEHDEKQGIEEEDPATNT